MPSVEKVVIIGAGWYGVHTALSLKDKNPELNITILEKETEIFKGISGMFGIRLHVGPHYPRSKTTRKDCRQGLKKFKEVYPELINEYLTSLYLLGDKDADGCPPKVHKSAFKKVCEEFGFKREIDPKKFGFTNVNYGAIVDEPTAKIGKPLRTYFKERLLSSKITMLLGFFVTQIENTSEGIQVKGQHCERERRINCNFAIHANSYQSLLPKQLPSHLQMVYQPCLALQYRYIGVKIPLVFIIMDGAYPCLMPYFDEENSTNYVMTHGKWTILGTYPTAAIAKEKLNSINDHFIVSVVKKRCEFEMKRFYKAFFENYVYIGWKGAVLAKPAVGTEFRSSLTFKEGNIIYITPGKITNIFEVAEEVNCLLTVGNKKLINEGSLSFTENGILARARREINESSLDGRSTANLQPYKDLTVIQIDAKKSQIRTDHAPKKIRGTFSFLIKHEPDSFK